MNVISISEKMAQSQNETAEPPKTVWKHFRTDVSIDGKEYSTYASLQVLEEYKDDPAVKKEAEKQFILALRNGSFLEFFEVAKTRKDMFPILINLSLVKTLQITGFWETDEDYKLLPADKNC